ncbi:MAG TPA: TetR/AcrR family transcriptional regulator [Gaiellaceae bacterium]|jgi:AcrR family transcriptional regulator|nr:TetR/AcrR family transcriptional regulator [Gaiellaceae bacterium]
MPKVSDAHRAARRRQILDGARRAFAQFGYEGATVARLELETGLSRGAIFNYFPDKWSIFYALAVDDYDRFGRLWLEEGYGTVVRRLASENPDWLAVYLELIRKLRTRPDLHEQWSKRSPDLNVAMKEHIEELQREGELRQDLSALELGRFMGLLLDGIAVQVSAGYPVEVEPLLRLVSAAIAPQ